MDLFGIAADYPVILDIAGKYDLLVLEDAAQSFGGVRFGRPVGNQGAHCAGTSFFPAKPMGCYGDGGAIFTNDDDLAALLVSIRAHGRSPAHRYDHVRLGFTGRLDTLQAAVLLAKADVHAEEIQLRQDVAARYGRLLGDVPGLTLPESPAGCTSAWAQYTVRIAGGRRDAAAAYLGDKGIPTAVYYEKPLTRQTVFASLEYRPEDMPVSEKLCREVLSLPFSPYITEEEQRAVAESLRESLNLR